MWKTAYIKNLLGSFLNTLSHLWLSIYTFYPLVTYSWGHSKTNSPQKCHFKDSFPPLSPITTIFSPPTLQNSDEIFFLHANYQIYFGYDDSHHKLNHKRMAEGINKQNIWVSMYWNKVSSPRKCITFISKRFNASAKFRSARGASRHPDLTSNWPT